MAESEFTIEEIANEVWRNVDGWEGIYSVSNLGRVRRNSSGYILKHRPNHKGYLKVSLSFHGRHKQYRISALVAKAFIGSCPSGKEINHIDTNKRNNRSTNLEYLTHTENMLHAYRHKLVPALIGHINGNTKLSDEDVRAIREATGSVRKIAADFHVASSLVHRIRKRVSRTYVN